MSEQAKQINELAARILQLEQDKQELLERLSAQTNAAIASEARWIQNTRDAQDAINKCLIMGGKEGLRILIRYKQRAGDYQ